MGFTKAIASALALGAWTMVAAILAGLCLAQLGIAAMLILLSTFGLW